MCKILYLIIIVSSKLQPKPETHLISIIIGSDVWLGWTNTHTVEPVNEVEPLIRLGGRFNMGGGCL